MLLALIIFCNLVLREGRFFSQWKGEVELYSSADLGDSGTGSCCILQSQTSSSIVGHFTMGRVQPSKAPSCCIPLWPRGVDCYLLSGRLLTGEEAEAVGEGGAGNSEAEGLDERLELLLLGTRLVREGTLGSMKNTDPVTGSALSAHASSSMLYHRTHSSHASLVKACINPQGVSL